VQERKVMKSKKEGDLYKTIIIDGVVFDIRYGYYEETDRYGKYNDPIPIYPDLVTSPKYNADGYRIVTEMQDVCEHSERSFNEGICVECSFYKQSDELIGICKHPKNKI
jgi:hypothetical protein